MNTTTERKLEIFLDREERARREEALKKMLDGIDQRARKETTIPGAIIPGKK